MTRARDLSNLIGSGNYVSETLTATAGQTAFTVTNGYTPNFVQVFMNGLLLDPVVDYAATTSPTITLTTAANAGDELEVVKYNTFSVGDAITQTDADARYVNAAGDTMTGALTVNNQLNLTSASGSRIYSDVANAYTYVTSINPAGSGLATHYHNANEFRIQTGNTDRLAVDSAGRVTMPYQPHVFCRGYNTTVSNVAVYDTVHSNNGNHYNNSTGLFTAPVAGVYYVGAFSGYKNSSFYLGLGIQYNGTPDVYGWSASISDLNHANNTVNYVRYLNAGDTVGAWIASSYTTPSTDTSYMCFSVTLLG